MSWLSRAVLADAAASRIITTNRNINVKPRLYFLPLLARLRYTFASLRSAVLEAVSKELEKSNIRDILNGFPREEHADTD